MEKTAATFETTNRRLEQFLFAHFIRYSTWYKGADGMTVWVYPSTAEVMRVVAEFRALVEARRNAI